MPFVLLSEAVATTLSQTIRLIATDMDGTLTSQGKFNANLFQALESLTHLNLPVLIVTGRSAGWVSGLAHYLPITGAIAENGGLFYTHPSDRAFPLIEVPDWTTHRQQLAHTFRQLQRSFPQLRESADNAFRLTDWTFDVQGLSLADIQALEELCQAEGWSFTYSTVQCHIKPQGQDKATGLLQVLREHFPQIHPDQVLTIGDSPNDESLFDPARFPHSIGVANIQHYQDQLTHLPAYVTHAAEGAGFVEIAQSLTTSLKGAG